MQELCRPLPRVSQQMRILFGISSGMRGGKKKEGKGFRNNRIRKGKECRPDPIKK